MKKFMFICSIILIPVFVISALCLAFKDTWFKKEEKQIVASASGTYDYSKIESSLEDAKLTCEFEIDVLEKELDELRTEIADLKVLGEDVSDLELQVSVIQEEINEINDELILILTRLDIINGSISNENILINGEFDVNQRGSETYTISSTETTYTLDRWASNTTGAVITKTDTGVSITASNTDVSFFQYVEADVINRLLTFSVMFEDNTLEFITATLTDSEIFVADFETSKLQLSVAENGFCKVEIIVKANNSISLRYAKLEVGELWTLYTPQNIGKELLNCQRYYLKTPQYWDAYTNAGGVYLATITSPVSMRAGKLKSINYVNAYMFGSNYYQSFSALSIGFSLLEIRSNQITIQVYSTGGNMCANFGIPYSTNFRIVGLIAEIDSEIY